MESLYPYLGQITFGGAAGFATGYALKKIARFVAVVLGITFITLQLLAQAGYVQIDWVRIQNDVQPFINNEEAKSLWDKLIATLTYSLPFGASFTVGFFLGFKAG